ncbi:TPA: hypothetical protein OMT00_001864 [Klebsiella aerogenes]|nr:hypothetical protein [Klebsiella aerogenes]
MTDITELVQREKFDAWFKSSFHPDKTGPYIKDQLYFAWKAAGAELVEALEKAQQQTTESENRVRKQNRHICELFDDNTALRQRIAELEEAEQQLCAANVTLDARAELAERQLAELESRTVTVKLPQRYSMLFREGFSEDYRTEVTYMEEDIQEMLIAAGIKWEAE